MEQKLPVLINATILLDRVPFFFFAFSFSLKMKCNETYSKISFPFFLSFRSQIQGSGFDFLLPVVNIKPHCIQVYFPHFVQLGFSLGFL